MVTATFGKVCRVGTDVLDGNHDVAVPVTNVLDVEADW
jgi:hypothetical protein